LLFFDLGLPNFQAGAGAHALPSLSHKFIRVWVTDRQEQGWSWENCVSAKLYKSWDEILDKGEEKKNQEDLLQNVIREVHTAD
jgi:hypothetical protein